MAVKIISFNGGECVGKTSIIEGLAKELTERHKRDVKVFQGLGSGPIGAYARERFLQQDMTLHEAALFKLASHVDMMGQAQRWVNKAKGNVALIDRDFMTYAAYDVCLFNNTFAKKLLDTLFAWDSSFEIQSDISFHITVPASTLIKRMQARSESTAEESFLDSKALTLNPQLDEYYYEYYHLAKKTVKLSNSGTINEALAYILLTLRRNRMSLKVPSPEILRYVDGTL